MLSVTTEAWHSSRLWKGLRREVDGVHAKDTAGGWVGGQDSKTTGFCHLFSDARFLIDGFCHVVYSLTFRSKTWVA